jgi:AraC family transcriptional regulator, regulatory protein of adaptative response / DNA-3-methyladenine glycosylase II
LLTETSLPIIRVAYASGFESVRRFNALFRNHYRLTPTRMRRLVRGTAESDCIRLTLAYRPPFAWPELLRFLAGRSSAGVECITGDAYLRTVAIGKYRGWLRATPLRDRHALSIELATNLVPALPVILSRLRNLFDLDARPDVIAADLRRDSIIGKRVKQDAGLRVPGAFDGFELVVRAVLGQRISVKAATTLAGRVAAAFGEPVATPFPCLNRLTPSAERLAEAKPADLTGLGITAPRAASIIHLAGVVARDQLDLSPGPDPQAVIQALTRLPEIGRWTAQYVAMRALRWPDAFPDGDLGLLRGANAGSARELRNMAEAWRPWRAYAAMHLWQSLHQK